MKHAVFNNALSIESTGRVKYSSYLLLFITGTLGPLGFAPFHVPGLTIISLAILYWTLSTSSFKQCLGLGFAFGFGYFSLGVSWVIVSIHDYGQMNYILSGLITILFVSYLALFPTLVACFFKLLLSTRSKLVNLLLFSSLWCLSEFARANLFSGFPWLLIGTTQIDTPVKYLAPILGVYGVSFWSCVTAALLTYCIPERAPKRYRYLFLFVLMITGPVVMSNIDWTTIKREPITLGVIQANLSMRDKWDETLFWSMLKYYKEATESLLGKQLIILPESAIPLPASYLDEYLTNLHQKALTANSAIILGILQPTDNNETHYYNSVISLGKAKGQHVKKHLVPFGEYIPKPFVGINHWLNLPEPNIVPGKKSQNLIQVGEHPIASLICYEIAYPHLLRMQMPLAQWIVSISDNGWFGRSLASYQQLQMAQFLSLMTGRFQIVVNNDGLSSVINNKGDILDGLPPFSSGILQSEIFPASGSTPWIQTSDYPSLIFCSIILVIILFLRLRRFSKQ
ncbi:MAG: apolipoprotein N-acyltransferase [Legionella sp.]|nr:apolipoprotein N-acyltransferase [Legionella sp.]